MYNENICSSSGGAQEKGKTGWNSVYYQNWWSSEFHPLLNANELFCMFFLNLTLCMTKLRVLVLCFSYFMDNSIMWLIWIMNLIANKGNVYKYVCSYWIGQYACALTISNPLNVQLQSFLQDDGMQYLWTFQMMHKLVYTIMS